MAPALATGGPAMTTSRREIAESEDIHFGGAKRGNGFHHHQDEEESLLGQALQLPSLGGVMDGFEDEDELHEEGSSIFESLTPTFSGRKQWDGNRTPQQGNFFHQHNSNSNNSFMNSSSSTRHADNRGTGGGVLSHSSSVDPLSQSTRSLQSDDFAIVPQSVDTVPTSNLASLYKLAQQNGGKQQRLLHTSPDNQKARFCVSPPSDLRFHPLHSSSGEQSQQPQSSPGSRRNVFGSRVQQKYPAYGTRAIIPPTILPADPAPFYNIITTGEQITFQQAAHQPEEWAASLIPPQQHQPPPPQSKPAPPEPASSEDNSLPVSVVVTASSTASTTPASSAQFQQSKEPLVQKLDDDKLPVPMSPNPIPIMGTTDGMVSPLQSPPQVLSSSASPSQFVSPTRPQYSTNHNSRRRSSRKSSNKMMNGRTESLPIHETVHAQSLLLGLCFMAIWSPNNIMAPNLTQIATFYGMNQNERDLYLGSYMALATGVLSFPLSALIGILTDLHSRKILFVATAMGGAIASAATGYSPTYPCLLLARFFSGGFMSASVSVAFSLMGDLFATEERNAASSGLTAMMGLGIILGQVYAGTVGSTKGWQHPFWVSSGLTVFLGLCVACLVQEPVRGGKEKVLQDMLQQGKRYDRKLTWDGFWHAMTNNRSNFILMAQGFFSSIPWGIIFVFLNDYLSQERGFSVPDATFIVLVFGVGCAAGGILGGCLGAWIQSIRRSFLPLFMAATTLVGVVPYLALLDGHTTNAHGYWAILYSFMAGCISSMPAVNVRPCLINVNPPETRGASLTAANLIINVARGVGPSCITLLGSTFDISRQASFNITLIAFFTLSALQLCCLAQTLPHDQDEMEAELARYAASALASTTPLKTKSDRTSGTLADLSIESDRMGSFQCVDDASIVTVEDRMTSFEGTAAREAITFFKKGMRELNFSSGTFCAVPHRQHRSYAYEYDSGDEYYDEEEQRNDARNILNLRDEGDDTLSPIDLLKRRDLWRQQQQKMYGTLGADDEEDQNMPRDGDENPPATESTRLLV